MNHPRARQSLGREVAALGGNLHPALAALYEDGTRALVPYLVSEYVDGIDLDDEIAERGALRTARDHTAGHAGDGRAAHPCTPGD